MGLSLLGGIMEYLLPDWLYNILKWIAIVALPVISWAVGELLPDYGIDPYIYVHHINVIAMMIGMLIGVSEVKARLGEGE